MELRAYRQLASAILSFSPLNSVPNQRPYAVLTQFPVTPHHFSNAGWTRLFGPVPWMGADSPWLFFDDQFESSILSAVSRPISQRQVWNNNGTANGFIALQIDSSNATLPAGDVYSHLITFGQGIGKTFNVWGSTLRNVLGRPITGNEADLSLQKPMLSTDAGASYYYNFDPALGYQGTLRAAIASAKAAGIPLGVVHFDSWWYLKGGDCNSVADPAFASWKNNGKGVWKFLADPALFQYLSPGVPEDGFIQNLGPGMAHGRWVDTCSAYRFPTTGPGGKPQSAPLVSGNVIVDPGLWQRIADGLKQSGMIIYEQDWLSKNAHAANTFDDEKFLSNMAAAMGKDGIDLQLCMPLARHLLQAFQYERVHTIRVSHDRFEWSAWEEELYGSIIVNAGTVWPAVDNFRTTEERNLLLAVLSAGPLALADPVGAFVPIPQAIRSDGLILKPDVAMVPSDASFASEATAVEQFYGISGTGASNAGNKAKLIRPPLISHTYSDFGASKVEYVFAYSRNQNGPAQVSFAPQDFGLTGSVYVYDYFGKMGWRQPASQAVVRLVDSQGSYFVMAPIGPSGMAFLGDLSKFATASKQRVTSLSDKGQISAALQFAPGETVPISFFGSASPVITAAPVITADGATVSVATYDSTTGLYRVSVTPGPGNTATIRIAAGQ